MDENMSAPKQATLKERLNALIQGQVVQEVAILDERELVVFFESGSRLFVDAKTDLNISFT